MSIMYVFVPHLAWGEPFPSKYIALNQSLAFLARLPEKTSEFKHGCDKLPHTSISHQMPSSRDDVQPIP
jgi:hypothetical protein